MNRRFVRKLFRTIYTLVITYTLIIGVVGGVLFFAPELWSPPLRQQIEKQALNRAGLTIVIEKLRLVDFWPLTMRLDNVRIKPHPSGVNGNVGAIDISIWAERISGNIFRPKMVLAVKLLRPHFEVNAPDGPKEQSSATSAPPQATKISQAPAILSIRPVGLDFGFRFAIESGDVVVRRYATPLSINDFRGEFELPSTIQAWWRPTLKLQAVVESEVSGTKLKLPVDLNIIDASLNPQSFNFDKVVLSLAGLQLNGKGQHLWKEGTDSFYFRLKESDLSQVPAAFLPEGTWHGKFSGGVSFKQKPDELPEWKGELYSQEVKGELDWSQGDMNVKGSVALKSSFKFQFKEKLILDDSSILLDLTNAETQFKPWFHKPSGVDMALDIVADSRDQQFWLRRALLRLAHLRLEATGKFELKNDTIGQLDFILPVTPMAGLEKYFPPFAQVPARGDIGAFLKISGPMKQPQKLTFELKNLLLQKISGSLKYETMNQKINGPFSADLKISGLQTAQNVVKAEISGQADLSYLQVEWGDWLKKPAPWKFTLNGQVSKLGTVWNLNQLRISSQGGALNLNGRIQPGTAVGLDLKSQIESINLTAWNQVVHLPNYTFGGVLVGELSLGGKYFMNESLGNSPLTLAGDLHIRDGVFKVVLPADIEDDSVVKEKEKSPVAVIAPAWLPPWPLFRQAFLKAEGNFREVQIQDLKMSDLTFEGLFNNSRWKGSARVKDLWGGDVTVSKIIISPLAEPAHMEMLGNWSGVQAGSLLQWFNPKLKNYLSGSMNGRVSILGTIPNPVDGYKSLRAEGSVQLSQAQFKTFQIEEKINEGIEKLRLRTNNVKGAPVNFQAQTTYELLDGNLNLSNFLVTTDKRDELRLRGLVRRDLAVDLSGTVAIASVKVSGAVAAANGDQFGRLVVPLQIKGDIRQPNFAISGNTLKTMLTKTVEKEAKDIGEKLKKDLGTDLKKKLKNIFGK